METIELEAIDGARVRAFVARPSQPPRGLVVVVQEIFGVNDHIRWVLEEQYARHGWLAVAPCFFDRLGPNIELGYSEDDFAQGRELVMKLGFDAPMRDIDAARRALSGEIDAANPGARRVPAHADARTGDASRARVGVVGYCWGGTAAYLAATRLGLPGVGYYGARTVPYLHERLQAPVLMHFGADDPSIDAQARSRIEHALPDAPVHTYAGAGHAFNRYGNKAWHEPSARVALERTLAFFDEHLA